MLTNFISALALASLASAATFSVAVGGEGGNPIYTPNSITAKKGDVVNFVFSGSPGAHTVSQAAFGAPCAQLENGFDSGVVSVASNFKGSPVQWNLTITDDSKPIWFYCKQTQPVPHCLNGMVGAINAPSSGDNTLEAFTNAAKALKAFPTQEKGSLTGVGASASSTPSADSSNSPQSSSISPSPTSTNKPSSGIKLASSGVGLFVVTILGVMLA